MSRYGMNKLFREMIIDEGKRAEFARDAARYATAYDLTDEERQAVLAGDYVTMYRLGAHPFLLAYWVGRAFPGKAALHNQDYAKAVAPYGRPDFRT
ncbi:MAG TPA: hypothetical protein VFB90_07150 [Dehalococcoidia bacterium]|nr:hypothetical protein [Dehalococcoidia bacterium]